MTSIVTDIDEWRYLRQGFGEKTVGFVATMGYLHEGHLSLCKRSRDENEITVVSIFVNPTQFNQASDFEKYPRDFLRDQALLKNLGIDYVFMPEASAIYPDDYSVQLCESDLANCLEGEFRPGHFSGMLTIVLKLFNLVKPVRAYFGEKDYQQYLLIEKMVSALFLDIHVVACPTLREKDGLALSSRNVRLSEVQRQAAALLPKVLHEAESCELATKLLQQAGFKVDYIAECWGRRLVAVWIDEVRLIDNIKWETEC